MDELELAEIKTKMEAGEGTVNDAINGLRRAVTLAERYGFATEERAEAVRHIAFFHQAILDQLQPRWIPVEGALPERNGRFLVVEQGTYVSEARYSTGKPHGDPVGWFNNIGEMRSVTHWMDLPPRPV